MRAEARIMEGCHGVRILTLWSSGQLRILTAVIIAVAVGATIWHLPIPQAMDERALHFLASLSMAVILWSFDVMDDYIVALVLLLCWLTIEKLPAEIALSGFASSEWFFALATLGMAATVTKVGLLRRVALSLLKRVPANFTAYNFILSLSGLLVTPCLPNAKSRMAIAAPVTQAISDALGFRPRSNASAALALSTYVGFTQMSFMFLTGMSSNLIGWNLLPTAAREQFGWGVWALAAFPTGVFTLLVLVSGIRFIFSLDGQGRINLPRDIFAAELQSIGPMSSGEWISIFVLIVAVGGWLTKPIHGIGEAWVGLGCFLVFLLAGVMKKDDVKHSIDWSFMIFFGIISTLGDAVHHVNLDRWLINVLTPVLRYFSGSSEIFLGVVLLLVYLIRFVLHKSPVMVLFMVGLIPWAESLQIHPGVLLITIVMGLECWFLPYQTDSYLIAYSSTGGNAFSHAQGRKLMLLKFFVSFLALLVSIPYWKALGLMP